MSARFPETTEKMTRAVKMRDQGLTYEEIGVELSCTREYARVLLGMAGYDLKEGRRLTRERSLKRQVALAKENEANILSLIRQGYGDGAISRKLSLSLQLVKIISERVPRQERRTLKRKKRWALAPDRFTPEDELIECLQKAARVLGEPLRRKDYSAYAAKKGWRGEQTIANRFGTWNKACDRAGITTIALDGFRSDRMPDAECIDAIRRCREDIDSYPTIVQYNEWRTERWKEKDSVPSESLLRARFGFRWASVLITAFPELKEDSQ